MPFALIPLMLLIIPIMEIAAFIAIGKQIGTGLTLLMILVTAVVGTGLLRFQGLSLINRIRTEIDAGRVPGKELGEGAMILVAGILLLTPGFITDALGFLLFVPQVRSAIWSFIASRITVVGPGGMRFDGDEPFYRQRDGVDGGPIIDLDEDEYSSRPANPKSPWKTGPDAEDGPNGR